MSTPHPIGKDELRQKIWETIIIYGTVAFRAGRAKPTSDEAAYSGKSAKAHDKIMALIDAYTIEAEKRAELKGAVETAEQIWGVYNARSRENPEEKMFDFDKWLPGQIEDWKRQLHNLNTKEGE